MRKWFQKRWAVIKASLGIRSIVIGVIVTALASRLGFVFDFFVDNGFLDERPPTWALSVVVGFLYVFYYVLDYAVALADEKAAGLEFLVTKDGILKSSITEAPHVHKPMVVSIKNTSIDKTIENVKVRLVECMHDGNIMRFGEYLLVHKQGQKQEADIHAGEAAKYLLVDFDLVSRVATLAPGTSASRRIERSGDYRCTVTVSGKNAVGRTKIYALEFRDEGREVMLRPQ